MLNLSFPINKETLFSTEVDNMQLYHNHNSDIITITFSFKESFEHNNYLNFNKTFYVKQIDVDNNQWHILTIIYRLFYQKNFRDNPIQIKVCYSVKDNTAIMHTIVRSYSENSIIEYKLNLNEQ